MHYPAIPVKRAKMIVEAIMFSRIIGSNPPEVYLGSPS
jgi:hypothetical protein